MWDALARAVEAICTLLAVVLCTPVGWIGLLVLAAVIKALQ